MIYTILITSFLGVGIISFYLGRSWQKLKDEEIYYKDLSEYPIITRDEIDEIDPYNIIARENSEALK